MPQIKLVHVLIATLVVGASFAACERGTPSADNAAGAPKPAAEKAEPSLQGVEEPPAVDAATVEGDVLELLDVAQYTYARLGKKGSEDTWIAFPATPLKVGQHVRLGGAMKMTDFASKSLKRTFPTIWFGTLEDGNAQHGAAPGVHAPLAGSGAEPADPHGADPHAKTAVTDVEVTKVERATGPNAATVAEAIGRRTELAGKSVRIRAVVVKMTGGVLGRTYLHLRDGSGDATAGTNDLSATTAATPAVGETVVLEGTLGLDRDIGSGYKFPTILEDAVIVAP